MSGEFLPVLILLGVAALLCSAMVVLSWVLGPRKRTPYKSSPYECGVAPLGDALERVPIKFYLVAIVFVLFDIEVVFLWSLMSVFRDAAPEFKVFTGIALGIYMLLWIIGDAYVLRVGAIDWDESTTIAKEKMQDTAMATHGSNAAIRADSEATA
ncbi:MAG TPA: NADH-quinone oxidoreductase subunit A [Fimbriimonadaceae bacterium]|nr:NADH-quinone oxidoreductase subunit A [Fimbriimonadaceae bacterium]